ncbi:MAG: 2Fe-2S iron-sulfur cluster binding domain-containing protein [Pseudomonadota bacterium]
MGDVYTVRLEPVNVEFEVEEDETILDAAFRQGIALPHGCKEGQCSACKCTLLEGEVDLAKYSTFALNDMERDQGGILLCRSKALSDLDVELHYFDEELLEKAIAVKTFTGHISHIERLTHDIRCVTIDLEQPLKFWAGQYVDITVTTQNAETITRSFSMANPPSETQKLQFIIKRYPGGQFSGELDEGGAIAVGAPVKVTGPYGGCFRRDGRDGHVILVAAGSGMSPIWSILHDHIASGEQRPVVFFYGARTQKDLFYLEALAELTEGSPSIQFIPVLSDADDDDSWTGERGMVHEAVARHLNALDLDGVGDVYACGPPPMIEALTPALYMNGFEFERIFFDKFTPSTASPTLETAG